MPELEDQDARTQPPLVAYLLASALLWVVFVPVAGADGGTGQLRLTRVSVSHNP